MDTRTYEMIKHVFDTCDAEHIVDRVCEIVEQSIAHAHSYTRTHATQHRHMTITQSEAMCHGATIARIHAHVMDDEM